MIQLHYKIISIPQGYIMEHVDFIREHIAFIREQVDFIRETLLDFRSPKIFVERSSKCCNFAPTESILDRLDVFPSQII